MNEAYGVPIGPHMAVVLHLKRYGATQEGFLEYHLPPYDPLTIQNAIRFLADEGVVVWHSNRMVELAGNAEGWRRLYYALMWFGAGIGIVAMTYLLVWH